ncbi:hypothetical protein [Taklimakanibacter deserti]|uniref:hypothetical protein n=1 Tax=Taklimakanibacter deserti TaxID=2267839 RepID=UPI000E654A72
MAQINRERLLAYLKEAQIDAAKADEKIECQRALIDSLQACGADAFSAMTALKTLELERDLHRGRIEMILNQLGLDT